MDKYQILGIGVVTSFGSSKEDFWQGLTTCREAFSDIRESQHGELVGWRYGRVDKIQFTGQFDEDRLRGVDRNTLLMTAAAVSAIDDARQNHLVMERLRVGISCGASISAGNSASDFFESVLVEGPQYCRITLFPNTVMNAPAGRIAILLGITGCNMTITSGWNSGLDAIGHGCLMLAQGAVDAMLCIGGEALSDKLLLALRTQVPSTSFSSGDIQRNTSNGFEYGYRQTTRFPAEGAISLILVREGQGAYQYGALSGYVSGFTPSVRDIANRAKQAGGMIQEVMKNAGVSPEDIGVVFLNGGGGVPEYQAAIRGINLVSDVLLEQCPVVDFTPQVGSCYGCLGPMCILTALGYFHEAVDPNFLVRNNMNGKWKRAISRHSRALVLGLDRWGHDSALLVQP